MLNFGSGGGFLDVPVKTGLIRNFDAATAAGLYTDNGTTPVSSSGQAVYLWTDKASGYNATQATSTLRPVWTANLINGLGGVAFDGVDDVMTAADTGMVTGNSDRTGFFVVEFRSITFSGSQFGGWSYGTTGSDTFVRPSMGAWISYGLGTENQNLPSFITINPTLGHGGVGNWSSAFLPAVHQGTPLGGGMPVEKATIQYLQDPGGNPGRQRAQLDLLGEMNREHLAQAGVDPALEARIESFELAFRMQTEAPEILDLKGESAATQRLYGLDQPATSSFARQCLLARRFSERGVRFVQVTHGYWDQHEDLTKDHGRIAAEVDRPIAGLLRDLKSRGLLEETLVIWGGEFGRTPTLQGKDGRDHHPHAFTMWLAGGGVKAGFSYGRTDDYGFYCVDEKVHVHDLHATLLALLGMDHEALTYRHAGRDFRLTDVAGRVVSEIFA